MADPPVYTWQIQASPTSQIHPCTHGKTAFWLSMPNILCIDNQNAPIFCAFAQSVVHPCTIFCAFAILLLRREDILNSRERRVGHGDETHFEHFADSQIFVERCKSGAGFDSGQCVAMDRGSLGEFGLRQSG